MQVYEVSEHFQDSTFVYTHTHTHTNTHTSPIMWILLTHYSRTMLNLRGHKPEQLEQYVYKDHVAWAVNE